MLKSMEQAAKIAALYARLVESRERQAASMRALLSAGERKALNDEVRAAERTLQEAGAPIPSPAALRSAAALRFGRS
jgi:hypothetical protein